MSLLHRHFAEKCSDCRYQGLRLFCNLKDDALRRFDQIGAYASLPSRSVLFEEGQRASSVFIVCAGQLKLSTTSREGRTMILRLAGSGDLLGLSATLSNLPHEVTAETTEPTELKSVPKREFLEFLDMFSEVGRKTSETLAREYHTAFLDARRLALSGSAAGRLAWLLIQWANTSGCGKPDLRFTMALTHEELASMAGASRETVTRLLNQFERDGLITRRGASLTIIDSSRLSNLSQ